MSLTKKRFLCVAFAVLIFGTIAALSVFASAAANNSDQYQTSDVQFNSQFKNVLIGEHGTAILVDMLGNKSYSVLVNALYPNGLVDEQGQALQSVSDAETVRTAYVNAQTKLYAFQNGDVSETEATTFSVSLSDKMNGSYQYPFKQVIIGDDAFVFPFEWGAQPFGFLTLSEKGIYIVYTDLGIWRINPQNQEVSKLTSDSLDGRGLEEVSADIYAIDCDWYLTWIDDVHISPDGNSVVYRTNRDATALNETSVWILNIGNGSETQLVQPGLDNEIVGFLSINKVVTGALHNTKITDINSGVSLNITLPELPNFRINSVQNGKLIYSSYANGSSDTTMYIDNVDAETGAVTVAASFTGYLDGVQKFSPNGNKIAAVYGTDPMVGVADILVYDIENNAFSEIKGNSAETGINGSIVRYAWIDDNHILIETQILSDFVTSIISLTNAEV